MSLSLSHWYPGSGVVLDCIDSCTLTYFYEKNHRYIWSEIAGEFLLATLEPLLNLITTLWSVRNVESH